MIWLLGSTSQLYLENKHLIYKAMIKFGTMASSFGDLQQLATLLFYSDFKIKLRTITNAACCVTNNQLHNDLNILSVEDEIKRYSSNYIDHLKYHQNPPELQEILYQQPMNYERYTDIIQLIWR